jgi:hypothetical protein
MTTKVTILNHGPQHVSIKKPGGATIHIPPHSFTDAHIWEASGTIEITEAPRRAMAEEAATVSAL